MLSLRVKAAPTPSFYPLSLVTSSFVPAFEPSIQSSSFAPFTVAPRLRLSWDSWLYYDYHWYYERVSFSSWLSRDFVFWSSPLTTRGNFTCFKYTGIQTVYRSHFLPSNSFRPISLHLFHSGNFVVFVCTLIKSINPSCHPHFRVKDRATVSKSPIVVSPLLPFHASLRYPANIRPHPNKNTSYTPMMLVFLFELELISHV
ncbi:hypothetical protein AGABI1DRAFT_125604 [Agaricus bisporus var. burnettii JB137-S8]|uniref:Uncharacterized protein n=1 Tax=Agaricus bisporus var. burnettii (strain JB137-S8 / ATCC MYA-4627 / FGSC 10392) TaxID=597362 RepID=K5XI39_AGABU|nr:uncharacterized protein AGABI1DRAFT_125604 [Agaricus bisporus var. burnettii JB137-S8]EKM83128.1 hypothetical protein AGABI1DRAFT_125604 [Agaricus bisporus var. burnettii JB137-S8]